MRHVDRETFAQAVLSVLTDRQLNATDLANAMLGVACSHHLYATGLSQEEWLELCRKARVESESMLSALTKETSS